MTDQITIPATLYLPDGPADLVPGSFEHGQPCYERDGQAIDVDVMIPDDLLAAGWYWSGSMLCNSWSNETGICISTGTYPPPPVPSSRGDCYTIAREYDRRRAELAAAPRKKVKIGKRAATLLDMPIVATPEPELAAEQLEMAL